MGKLVPGVNDLATLYPEVAKEADGWDPKSVAAKSSKTLRWLCAKGHNWEAPPWRRTGPHKSGCPFCAGRKVWSGFNDLASLYPGIASEAYGWDPSSVTAGSDKKVHWACAHGHFWQAVIKTRTPPQSAGCPYCSGHRVLIGVSDLASLFPDVAKDADGWDPRDVMSRSDMNLSWRCNLGHSWMARVASRTAAKPQGCPYCSGKRVLSGFNDLASLFPEVAIEADGWDPSAVTAGSRKKLAWKCENGHRWKAVVSTRKPPRRAGCPFCAGLRVLVGVNDLATLFPAIASEAEGWDPATLMPNSHKRLPWRCSYGHGWKQTPNARVNGKRSCPVCAGRQVLAGFNDLESRFPRLAMEADGWDPSAVTWGSGIRLPWRCENGHRWDVAPNQRTTREGSGCPECAESGYNPGKPAWFYLLERPGEQQIGITNDKGRRLRTHATFGWSEVEVIGPCPGNQALAIEKELKKWLRKEVGLVPGTRENWFTAWMEVRSLAELKARSGVETELF